jgi:hypothetical protein
MVHEGIMPKPKQAGGRVIWDRHLLDEYFADLPTQDEEAKPNVWDQLA